MIITAHGGALGTGRNSQKYFDTIHAYEMEAIEVDIRRYAGKLYLAHNPILPFTNRKKLLPLAYAFEFCVKYGKRINCDVKGANMVKEVSALAEKMNASQYVYFTGATKPKEIAHLGNCDAYVNDGFYMRKFLTTYDNLPAIKAYLESFNNPHLKGINVNYMFFDEKMLKRAKEIGLGVSIYTVDKRESLEKLMALEPDNVTTNRVDWALEIKKKASGADK